MQTFDLARHGVTVADVHRNLPPSALYEHAIRHEKDASIAENGALVAYSGAKTGRSPGDKRVVEHPDSRNDVWWGTGEHPVRRPHLRGEPATRSTTSTSANACTASTGLRAGIRGSASRSASSAPAPTHALFMHTMLIRPTKEELASFGEPDFVIINGGAFPANRLTTGMGSTTSIALSLEGRELVILGTEYAGEMKKGVFTVVNYFAPKRGHPLDALLGHRRQDDRRVLAALRLSGTGKTTLSGRSEASPDRRRRALLE